MSTCRWSVVLGLAAVLVAEAVRGEPPPVESGPTGVEAASGETGIAGFLRPLLSPPAEEPSRRSRRLFDEACAVAARNFFDPGMSGTDWSAVTAELGERAGAARGHAAVSRVINEALDRLHASHTHHYTPDQREYYELLDVFYPDGMPQSAWGGGSEGPVTYVGVGLVSRVIDGRVFAADVYPGGPADRAGVHVGDELVAVIGSGGAGGPPPSAPVRREWGDVSPFRGRAGVETTVVIQRGREESTRRELVVTPEVLRPHREFLIALRESARVIEREHASGALRRVGYIRVRSYAHPAYQRAIVELLETRLASCDGLILDLRGGWGGAKPEYLNEFNPSGVRMTMKVRGEDEERTTGGAWPGPMVVIIDSGTRSGKELVAFGLKKHGRARLVGERTAGAVLGGRPFMLSDGSLLLVAVSDVKVDGVRLEGVGVEPDVRVTRGLAYADGRDEQLDAALEEMDRMLAPVGATP